MSASTRSILAVVVVLAIAGAAYGAWEWFFSQGARANAVHAACVAEFEAGKAKLKSGLAEPSKARPGDGSSGIRDLSAQLRGLIDDVGGGVAEATCGALRESCRFDFAGEVCRRARERYGMLP